MDVNTCFATTEAYRVLAFYSHLIPALAVIVLGVFAFLRAKDRLKANTFLSFTIVFSLWLIGDLSNWMSNDYHLVAATWAPLDYLNIVFFLLLGCFVYADLKPNRFSPWVTVVVLALAAIPFVITGLGEAVLQMYQAQCEMIGNEFLALYKLGIEWLTLFAVVALGINSLAAAWGNWKEFVRIALVTGSILLFMGIFSGAERLSTITDIYELTLYSLFSLPVFILFLTIAITSYGTFRLGDYSVKVLFYVFLILAGTQFFFAGDVFEFLLAATSFGVVLTLGIMLFRSSEREIKARHELEIANTQQESLLHFISHEVKGYLTESQAGFAAIVEGDFGAVSDKLVEMARGALVSMRRGVATVMDLLDASNFKKGTMAFVKKEFDLRKAVREIMEELQPSAEEKGLKIDLAIGKGSYAFTGDEDKIRRHVIRNLIDNAIKYTPRGTVKVELTDGEKLRFMVKDSGVGITREDMRNLFTAGGHGKNAIKINVHSTGYGLFIVKEVVEAHGGKVWAESEGEGKGSSFIIEFPLLRS